MVKQACEAYGYKLDPNVEQIYTVYRKATIRVYLMHILLISGGRAKPASLPVCPTHMVGAESLGITEGFLCMELTGS